MTIKALIIKGLRTNPVFYRMINRLKGQLLHRTDLSIPLEICGSDYGAWAVPKSVIGSSPTVFSFGVGEDISWDLELIKRSGGTVHAFDPTPIAVGWIEEQEVPEGFHFHPLGLSDTDGEAEFQVPPVAGWHSFSAHAQPKADIEGTIRCLVHRLSTIQDKLGCPNVDILKMDIEGFEYAAIADILKSRSLPKCMLIEFHHGIYGIPKQATVDTVSSLRASGYRIFWISDVGREYGFWRNA